MQKDLESVPLNLASILPTPRGNGGKEASNYSAIPWCGKHLQGNDLGFCSGVIFSFWGGGVPFNMSMQGA